MTRIETIDIPGLGPTDFEVDSPIWFELKAMPTLWPKSWRQIWLDKSKEPDQEVWGNVFLAHALRRIGEAMFAAKWTGHELGALQMEELPVRPSAQKPGEGHQLFAALKRRTKPKALEGIASGSTSGSSLLWDLVAPATARQNKVFEFARASFRDGLLEAIPLPKNGGAFLPRMAKSDWVTQTASHRILNCAVNPDKLLMFDAHANLTHWIYVEAAQLEALIASILAPVARSAPKLARSTLAKFKEELLSHILLKPDRPERRDDWQAIASLDYKIGTKAFLRLWHEAMDEASNQVSHKWSAPGRGRNAARSIF